MKTIASLFTKEAEAVPVYAGHGNSRSSVLSEQGYRSAGYAKRVAQTNRDDANDAFEDKLSSLVQARQRLLAGSLELIGLDEIRSALAGKWPLLESEIIRLAQQELQHSLDANDSFRRHGDTSFLIHFGHLDKEAAEKKTRAVATRIKGALIEAIPEIACAFSVRPFVAVIDPAEITPFGSGLADALFSRLMKMQVDVVTNLRRRRRSLDRDIVIFFSPIWHAREELTTLNRCHVQSLSYSALSAQLQELVDADEARSITADIDYLVFAKSLEALHRLRQSGRTAPLLIPVELKTVANDVSCGEYVRLLGAIPAAYQRHVMLEICGVDSDAASDKIFNLVHKLKPFIGGVVVQLALDDKRITEMAASGVWGISTNIAGADGMDWSLTGLLQRFATADGVKGVNTIASGANSIALAKAAFNAGFTLIEGAGIYLPAKEPRAISRLRVQSLLSR